MERNNQTVQPPSQRKKRKLATNNGGQPKQTKMEDTGVKCKAGAGTNAGAPTPAPLNTVAEASGVGENAANATGLRSWDQAKVLAFAGENLDSQKYLEHVLTVLRTEETTGIDIANTTKVEFVAMFPNCSNPKARSLWDKFHNHLQAKESGGAAGGTARVPDAQILDQVAGVLRQPTHQKTLTHFRQPASNVFGTKVFSGQHVLLYKRMLPCLLADALQNSAICWSNAAAVQNLQQFGEAVNNNTYTGLPLRCLIGPTGIGKTATCLRALQGQLGVYVDIAKGNGSYPARVLHEALLECADKMENDSSTVEALRDAQTAFHAVHATMLLILEAFKGLSTNPVEAEQWMYLQLAASNHDYQRHRAISTVIKDVHDLVKQLTSTAVSKLVADLKKQLLCSLLVVDEAQVLLSDFYGKKYRPVKTERPVLAVLVDLAGGDPDSITGLVLAGTGLGIKQMKEIAASSAGKRDDEATKDEAKDVMITLPGLVGRYARNFMQSYDVTVPEGCERHFAMVEGRSRAVANLVSRRLRAPKNAKGNSPPKAKARADNNGSSGGRSGKSSTGGGGTVRSRRPSEHACAAAHFKFAVERVVENMAVDIAGTMLERLDFVCDASTNAAADALQLYRRIARNLVKAVVFCGGEITASPLEDGLLDFVNAGMCLLEKTEGPELKASLVEEVGIRALWKVCEAKHWNPAYESVITHMSNDFTTESCKGTDMELLFALDVALPALELDMNDPARKKVFGKLKVVEGWPSRTARGRCKFVDLRKANARQFLAAVQRYLKQPPVNVGMVFFLPPEACGPDLVAFLWVSVKGHPKQLVPWFIQVKRKISRLCGKDAKRSVCTIKRESLFGKKGKTSKKCAKDQAAARNFFANFSTTCLGTVCTSAGFTGPAMVDAISRSTPNDPVTILADDDLRKLMTDAGFAVASTAPNAK